MAGSWAHRQSRPLAQRREKGEDDIRLEMVMSLYLGLTTAPVRYVGKAGNWRKKKEAMEAMPSAFRTSSALSLMWWDGMSECGKEIASIAWLWLCSAHFPLFLLCHRCCQVPKSRSEAAAREGVWLGREKRNLASRDTDERKDLHCRSCLNPKNSSFQQWDLGEW